MAKPKKLRSKTQEISPAKSPIRVEKGLLPPFFTNSRLHCILIMVLSFVLYGNTLRHDYTQDDAIVIYDNMFTTKGLKGIPGILKYDTFYGFFKEEGKASLVTGGRYRPFTLMMYALEVQLFAPPKVNANGTIVKDKDGDIVYDPNVKDYDPYLKKSEKNAIKLVGHFVNVLLYGFTGIVLYLLLLQLLGPQRNTVFAYFMAVVAACLFIAHPIHTEVVANIKGRDEIVALLGSLAAAYFIIKAYHKKVLFSIPAAICFFIALMSKENAITFLGAVPLMMYIFTNAKGGQIVAHTLALVVPTVIFLGIRFAVLPDSGLGDLSMELMNNPYLKVEGGKWVHFNLGEKLATIFYTLGKYLQLLVFPLHLTHDYYPRHIAMMAWSDWQSILSLLTHIGLLAYGIVGLFKKDKLSFGILFYFGTLFIVSNIPFPVGSNMSERFIFMPSVGFCFVLALLLYRLFKRMNKAKSFQFKKLIPVLILGGIIIAAFSVRTILRNPVWENNFTLFTTDVSVSQNSAKLQNAVGGELIRVYSKVADENLKVQKLTEATQHLQTALKFHPSYKNSYLQLGNCYNYLKQYEKSVENYNKVLSMDPNDENARNNLGITYRDAGRYYGEEKGDLKTAINYLEKAYTIKPNEYETLRLLGVAYGVSGNNDKAIDFFSKALAVNPDNADALWNLGSAYSYAGNLAKANELHQKAIQIDPEVANRNKK
jgi:tetratricopeptide (TPR) repeat protein